MVGTGYGVSPTKLNIMILSEILDIKKKKSHSVYLGDKIHFF